MKVTNYPLGSEWRKWDLHVHTPASLVNDYCGDWNRYIAELEALPPEFCALGINDYIFLDGYKRLVKEKKENGRLKNIDILFPVLEFRIKKFAGVDFRSTKRVNFHVIFDPDLTAEVIESQFLNTIHASYSLDARWPAATWSGSVTIASLEALGKAIKQNVPVARLTDYGSDLAEGFNNLNVDEDALLERLKSNTFLKNKYLTAVGKSEWDLLQWNDGSIGEKKDLINKVDLVFTAAASVQAYQNAHNKLVEQNVNSLLLDCSDAHNFKGTGKDCIEQCLTWIKAAPTFEGLRQITFEPQERLRIQIDHPAKDFTKRHFSSVQLKGKVFAGSQVSYADQRLELNRNLVTVIGGRGCGKSILLDVLRSTFSEKFKSTYLQRPNLPSRKFDSGLRFTASVTRDDTQPPTRPYEIHRTPENAFEYLHVSQSEIKTVAESPKALSEAIGQLLGLQLNAPSTPQVDDMQAWSLEIWKLEQELLPVDEDGTLVDPKTKEQRQIARNGQLIETISTDQTKAEISQFTTNTQRAEQLGSLQEDWRLIHNDTLDFTARMAGRIQEANRIGQSLIPDYKPMLLPNLSQELQEIVTFVAQTQSLVDALSQANSEIVRTLGNKGIKDDVQTILDKVGVYQQEIENSRLEIARIDQKQKRLEELRERRIGSVARLKLLIANQIASVNAAFAALKAGKQDWRAEQKALIAELLKDIVITADVVFDTNAFYLGLADTFLNLRKFRQRAGQSAFDRVREAFKVEDYESFLRLLGNERLIDLEDASGPLTLTEFAAKADYFDGQAERNTFFDYLYSSTQQPTYLRVLGKLQYKGKEPEKLSVGQKGTFYVCMKLATDPFTTPFVFDQPEDDLDNEFIVSELVPIFKMIKRYRQVIIATHNANLVVNTDAEQIIIASNKDEQLSYDSGALEDPLIKSKIVTILEGGNDAFRKREERYGLTPK